MLKFSLTVHSLNRADTTEMAREKNEIFSFFRKVSSWQRP